MSWKLCLAGVVFSMGLAGGESLVREAKPGEKSPSAKVADLAWLEGTWAAEGIGGAPATEVYSAPAGGQMVGHFRQLKADGSVMFYEIVAITEAEGTLQYRLKHFNADLTGWEEKTVVQSFPLVAVEKDAWYFDGLTVKRDGANGMIGAVKVHQKDGSTRELVFRYKRK